VTCASVAGDSQPRTKTWCQSTQDAHLILRTRTENNFVHVNIVRLLEGERGFAGDGVWHRELVSGFDQFLPCGESARM
jgi:hypothetical protein